MSRKKTDKKIPRLEPQFHNILICKKANFRPFLEVLVEEPENISRQNLGVLIGIFQIDDHSEDSSYVVNYLISIIKKEYFSRASRGPVENFEASLHKANLALAKLATHENIGWIGRINAICAVIEKNNLFLSQTGNASAFLLRGNTIAELTELPAEGADSNPLKTFQDVISGKIEKDDKLILATKEIFDIFSLEEIKKSALKFSHEDFVQFLNTALVNELDQAATLVVDISEKIEETIESEPERKIEKMNVFSQTAFQKKPSSRTLEKERVHEEITAKERQAIIQELKEGSRDFVDKKTGHIYIKEPKDLSPENVPKEPLIDFSLLKEKFTDLAFSGLKINSGIKNKLRNAFFALWQKSHAKISEIQLKRNARAVEKKQLLTNEASMKPDVTEPEIPVNLETEIKTSAKLETEVPKKTAIMEKVGTTYSKLEIKARTIVFFKKISTGTNWLKNIVSNGIFLVLRRATLLTIKISTFVKNQWQRYRKTRLRQKYQNASTSEKYPWESIPPSNSQAELETKKTLPENKQTNLFSRALERFSQLRQLVNFEKILPDFSRLQKIIKGFNRKQKISATAILLALLIVPYWIVKLENQPEKKLPPVSEEIPAVTLPLEKDLRVSHIEKLDEVYLGNIVKIISLNDKFFAQKDGEIIDLESKKAIPIPLNFQSPELFFGMDDLNLLFLIKNNQILSLHPTTGKFQTNTFAFPANAKIVDAKTYLTYIYLLDTASNQLYRAPRAEGGFGEKTTWIKETIDLSRTKNIAINENVFLIDGQNIVKLFRGKKQTFTIEKTATPIAPDKLYAKNSGAVLYALDKTNSRILKLDNDGKILAQYYNAGIANATDFSVSEENNLVYILDKDGVKSFRMTQ